MILQETILVRPQKENEYYLSDLKSKTREVLFILVPLIQLKTGLLS